MKTKNKGGFRIGSGAKPKYGEKTVTFGVRCPISKVPELKEIIKSKLKDYEKTKRSNNE